MTLSAASVYPAQGETSELFAGGPKLHRTSSALEVDLGPDRSRGFMRATYNPDSSLRRVETFNERSVRISITEYGLSHGRVKGVVETSYDLEERGFASRWERTEADPSAPEDHPRVIQITEILDAKLGRRIEESRKTIDGMQGLCGEAESIAEISVARSVDAITGRFQGSAACPVSATENLGFDDGQEHPMSTAPGAPVCLDSSCGWDPASFGQFVRDTVQKGASCLARLGMKQMSAAQQKKSGDVLVATSQSGALAASNAALLRKSFALRNAAQLLMIYNQAKNTGPLLDAGTQTWFVPVPGVNDSAAKADQHLIQQLAKSPVGPIKFFCSKQSMAQINRAGAKLSATFRTNGMAMMSAANPGLAGWPMIMMRGNRGGAPRTEFGPTDQAELFHEMMHLLGFPHQEMGNTLPVHTACQTCCFPEGFTHSEAGAEVCGARGLGSIHERNCAICAGDPSATWESWSTGDKVENKTAYYRGIRSCFQNGNPL
jgi:hypothetical protein